MAHKEEKPRPSLRERMTPHAWAQNLNDHPSPVPDRRGSILVHGRGTISLDEGRWSLGAEWKLFGWSCGAAFGIGEEYDLQGSVRVPGVAFYWHVSTPMTRWLRKWAGYRERELSFAVHDWLLTFYPWVDPMGGWDSNKRWWQQSPSIHLKPTEWRVWSWLRKRLGITQKDTQEVLYERRLLVALPDVVTPVTFRWMRNVYFRWPFPPVVREGWIAEPEKPLPIPGKGFGDDAIYKMSLGSDCPRVEDAVGRVVASVYQTRLRRDGSELMKDSLPAQIEKLEAELQQCRQRAGDPVAAPTATSAQAVARGWKKGSILFKMNHLREGAVFETATLADVVGNGKAIELASKIELIGPDGQTRRVLKDKDHHGRTEEDS